MKTLIKNSKKSKKQYKSTVENSMLYISISECMAKISILGHSLDENLPNLQIDYFKTTKICRGVENPRNRKYTFVGFYELVFHAINK